jgi:hypothetical protein
LEVAVKKAVTVRNKVNPERPKLNFGLANVLAQSETVSKAFGPRLGFALMFTAVLATTSVSATTLFILAKEIGRLLNP